MKAAKFESKSSLVNVVPAVAPLSKRFCHPITNTIFRKLCIAIRRVSRLADFPRGEMTLHRLVFSVVGPKSVCFIFISFIH